MIRKWLITVNGPTLQFSNKLTQGNHSLRSYPMPLMNRKMMKNAKLGAKLEASPPSPLTVRE